ncbi:MAG: hypothetical protein ACRD0L_03395 [Acidimicrobiales bacterium]
MSPPIDPRDSSGGAVTEWGALSGRGWVPAGLGLALAAGLAAVSIARAAAPVARATGLMGPVVVLGALGVALTALAWRWPGTLGAGLAALVAQYAVLVAARGGPLDAWAPVEAAALVGMAELAAWGGQRRATVPLVEDRRLVWARGVAVLATSLGALGVGALVLAVAGVGGGGTAAWELAGGVAAMTAVAVAVPGLRRLGAGTPASARAPAPPG